MHTQATVILQSVQNDEKEKEKAKIFS